MIRGAAVQDFLSAGALSFPSRAVERTSTDHINPRIALDPSVIPQPRGLGADNFLSSQDSEVVDGE